MTASVFAKRSAILLALLIVPVLGGDLLRSDSLRTGRASYYHARSGQGTCGLPPEAPWDSLYASLSPRDFSGAYSCGACVRVFRGSDSVTVRAGDRCHGCRGGGIDLSRAAFRALAPLSAGRIQVTWRFVACPDSSFAIRRTPGSSRHWSSFHAWGMPWPLASLSLQGEDGTWRTLHHERHGHFTLRPLPAFPWILRSTDVLGQERLDTLAEFDPGDTLRLDREEEIAEE